MLDSNNVKVVKRTGFSPEYGLDPSRSSCALGYAD